jgi:ankyrin repeat protein
MPLPERPNLEYLKKLAKQKLQDLQRADASARLADAQLAVAREHGFASWRKLRAHLDALWPAGEPSGHAELPRGRIEEFYDAIYRADEATVERMLSVEPALVNARHPDGTTPLLAAADRNKPGLIALLLARGGDPDGVYEHSAHTPLSWAVTSEHFEVAEALRRGGVAPDLYCAAGLGDAKAVEAFFDAEGRLQDGASSTGSSRYAPDGTRLPCPPPSAREVVSDALYIACRNGKEEAVRILLAHGPDLSFRAFAGGTSLHWAYFSGSRAVIEALLRAGADPTLRDDVLRCTPRAFGICWPASEGWVSKVRQRLIDDPTLVNIMDAGRAPLHLAAKEGHLGVVGLLIVAGAHAQLRTAEGKTALDLARARPDHAGCVKVVEFLKDRVPRGREDVVDSIAPDDEEMFIAAIRDGDLGKVKSMLAATPGLIRSRRHGPSPILIACYHGKRDVVECLRGLLPALDIFEAAALGDRETAERLLDGDRGLANAVAEDGFGPLGLASFFHHESVVRLLLERGAQVDVASVNDMHVMPLHSAAAARSVPIARLLLERGAPVNARQGTSGLGFTPLMEAALNGQTKMVDLLLEYGADRTMRDEKGQTAGDHARQNGHAGLADHLG